MILSFILHVSFSLFLCCVILLFCFCTPTQQLNNSILDPGKRKYCLYVHWSLWPSESLDALSKQPTLGNAWINNSRGYTPELYSGFIYSCMYCPPGNAWLKLFNHTHVLPVGKCLVEAVQPHAGIAHWEMLGFQPHACIANWEILGRSFSPTCMYCPKISLFHIFPTQLLYSLF